MKKKPRTQIKLAVLADAEFARLRQRNRALEVLIGAGVTGGVLGSITICGYVWGGAGIVWCFLGYSYAMILGFGAAEVVHYVYKGGKK